MAAQHGCEEVMKAILVVEDDLAVRDVLVAELEDLGYDVATAGHGESALALLAQGSFGVLLTDIRLPGDLDGWDIAFRARELHSQIGVIYVSAYSSGPERRVENGIFIRKPYNVYTLQADIERVMPLDWP
jgi:CheY-like chemotaxis protein